MLEKPDNVYILMAGGVKDSGILPDHVLSRCKFVLPLLDTKKDLLIVSSSFSMNVVVKTGQNGVPISESSVIHDWFRAQGYTGEIICEQQSHDTVGSIFFVLAIYIKYLGLSGSNINFVTSNFHIDRVKYIAQHINSLFFNSSLAISFVVPDDEFHSVEREMHEELQMRRYEEEYLGLTSEKQFFLYFMLNHSNYNHCFGSEKLFESSAFY